MKLTVKDLLKITHECAELFIREDDGSTSKPLFHYHLCNNVVPAEILEREVTHFQPCPIKKYGRQSAALNVNVSMK